MRGGGLEPGLFGLGLGELSGLQVVAAEPTLSAAGVAVHVLAALVQSGVPHRPTQVTELGTHRSLLIGQRKPITTARQHRGTPPSRSAVLLVPQVTLDELPTGHSDSGHEAAVRPPGR